MIARAASIVACRPLAQRRLTVTPGTEAGSPDDRVAKRAEKWAQKCARMPADGIAIAKTGFGLVEQTMAYSGEEATGFLVHAFATNLRFEADEFNFVKERAKLGTSGAFKRRDEHFGLDLDD